MFLYTGEPPWAEVSDEDWARADALTAAAAVQRRKDELAEEDAAP